VTDVQNKYQVLIGSPEERDVSADLHVHESNFEVDSEGKVSGTANRIPVQGRSETMSHVNALNLYKFWEFLK
jgi:hypothetical protein